MLLFVSSVAIVAVLAQRLEWPMPEPLLVASMRWVVVYLSGRDDLVSGFAALA